MATSSASAAVGEVLRQPDDLVKLTAYRNKLLKEKAALDAKLQEGVRAKLDATREALVKLQESRTASALIREEMIEVGKLKRDKDEGEIFDKITLVSGVHRNFSQTAKMVNQLQSMADKVDRLGQMLQDDKSDRDGPLGPNPNLLPIHFQVHQLETFRNDTMQAAQRGATQDMEILKQWFEPLDSLIAEFEDWLWQISQNVVELVRRGHGSTVVRLLKIIEFESREDEKAVALRLVRNVANKDVAGKFRSIQATARVIKNYRHKLLDALERNINTRLEHEYDKCEGDVPSFLNNLEFVYKDIIRIQQDLEPVFPADYSIVEWMIKRYHRGLNKIIHVIVDSQPNPGTLLALTLWLKSYRKDMKELDIPGEWLQPPLLDGKAGDLLEQYVRTIITKLDEWTINLQATETRQFIERTSPPPQDFEGMLGMNGIVDFFDLVKQQILLAANSQRGVVLARVVSECVRVIRQVQAEWVSVITAEARKPPDTMATGFTDYLIALANDQLRGADYVEELQSEYAGQVSDKYRPSIVDPLNEAIEGYLDVAKKCTDTLVALIFNDLRPAINKLFTQEWYGGKTAADVIKTIRDYLSDYRIGLKAAIFDIVLEDVIDAFLINYLTALRRAPPRSLKMPLSARMLREDIDRAFSFFQDFKDPEELGAQFEVMTHVCDMLDAGADMVYLDFFTFAKAHGPQLDFVEAIMRARGDLDRSQVAEILEMMRRKVKEEGIEDPDQPTIMCKVQGQSGAAGIMANVKKYADNIAGQTGRLKFGRDD